MRYSKYNMKVFDWQSIVCQIIDPESLPGRLAFGAMSVATAVVTISHGAATIASLFVPTQGSRAAIYNAVKHFYLAYIQFVRNRELVAKQPYHLGQFKLCPHPCGSYTACPMGYGLLSAGIEPHAGKSWW